MNQLCKNAITTFILLGIATITSAQISITAVSNRGFTPNFRSGSVWNITVNSLLENPVIIYLDAEIARTDGRPVARLSSTNLRINPGVNVFSESQISTKFLKYINADFGRYEASNGFLPSGNYEYCIVIKCPNQDCYTALAELNGSVLFCDQIQSSNPTPLFLSFPMDEAKITETRPNFSWIPPMPIGGDPELSYRYTLVELKSNQSPENGLRRNRPIYTIEGLQAVTLAFPAELKDLEVGKRYGWQVDAVLGKTIVQTSETWEFEIQKEERKIQPMPYVRLKKLDTDIYTTLNELKFIYNERNIPTTLTYAIVASSGEKVDVSSIVLKTKRGENKYKVDLAQLRLASEQLYTLVVTDQSGYSYKLKFLYYYRN